MVATHPTGGRPVPNDVAGRIGTVTPRLAGGCPVPDDVAGTQLDFEFGITPLAVTSLSGRTTMRPASEADRPAPPTVLGLFAMATVELHDLADPVDS